MFDLCCADVKQYGHLIKSLSFLLKSYKPKGSDDVSCRSGQKGNLAWSVVYFPIIEYTVLISHFLQTTHARLLDQHS